MQKVGRISTTAAGRGAEHATHPGVNAGKIEKFRYSLDQADRESKGRDRDDGAGPNETDEMADDDKVSSSSYIVFR